MAQFVSITATPREAAGKGAARQTRFAGKVPAVIYGHGRATQRFSNLCCECRRVFRLLCLSHGPRFRKRVIWILVYDPRVSHRQLADVAVIRAGGARARAARTSLTQSR